MNPNIFIGFFWLVFIIYWTISALRAKKTIVREKGAWRWALFAVVVVLSIFPQYLPFSIPRIVPTVPLLQAIGVIFCTFGIAFAIWARVHLGRNWGMPMSLKEGHELVTSGPYAYVRHPIYTGILFAVLGSALVGGSGNSGVAATSHGTGIAAGTLWLIFFVFYLIYFFISAKTEEGIMTRQFPQAYPEYKKRTKMLVPFIF